MDKTTCDNEAASKVLSSFNVNGGQLTFVGEEELATLRLKAAWADKYYSMIMDAATLLYPDVKYWADTGSGFSVSLNVLTQMETDLFKFLKKSWLHFWE